MNQFVTTSQNCGEQERFMSVMVVAAVIRCRRHSIQRAFVISMMIIVLQGVIGWPLEPSLTPPAGNSVHIKARTVNGVQIYTCSGGELIFDRTSAILVDSSNSSMVIGTYAYVYSPKDTSAIGTWFLNNDDGAIVQTGHSTSEATAFLAQASSHRFEGTASLVSYIQQIPRDGGVPPKSTSCINDALPVHIPFEADYWFWTQDMKPPSVPVAISASGRMIEGFFGTGYVEYLCNGTSWQQNKSTASMYDVPGGLLIGRFFYKSHTDDGGDSFTWEVFSPNGWTVTAKIASPGVQVDGTSLPWRRSSVTSSIKKSTLGPITQVQMISTSGGMPPNPMQALPVVGKKWRSLFSCIYWFYTPS